MPIDSIGDVFIAVVLMAIIIFATRVFPFAVFSKREPPPYITLIGKLLPPLVMAILIIYSIKNIDLRHFPFGLPEVLALLSTILLHLWKRNAFISIFGSTILFMLLKKFLTVTQM